jgi:hypothetical protein
VPRSFTYRLQTTAESYGVWLDGEYIGRAVSVRVGRVGPRHWEAYDPHGVQVGDGLKTRKEAADILRLLFPGPNPLSRGGGPV